MSDNFVLNAPNQNHSDRLRKYNRQKLNNNFILYKIYFKYVLSSPTLLSRFIWTEDLYKHLSMINDMKEKHLENSVNMHVSLKCLNNEKLNNLYHL